MNKTGSGKEPFSEDETSSGGTSYKDSILEVLCL